MKKFIFSAVAVLAFAGSSMANTIELNESVDTYKEIIVFDDVQSIEEAKGATEKDCKKIRNFVATVLLNAGESRYTAAYLADFVYDACISIAVD